MKLYVQYGCGLTAPPEWKNFDASPTLRLQNIIVIGGLIKKMLKTKFPSNVLYGDILKGLPNIELESCDGVYCSHVLEHLSYNDFKIAIKNTYDLLKRGGIFRCVLPDLYQYAKKYIDEFNSNDPNASYNFMIKSHLGRINRAKNFKDKLKELYGNSFHLWMWDEHSLGNELKKVGFTSVRKCSFNDSHDEMFKLVEEEGRFKEAIAFECIK
jgi:SAM-dependent methyltransferase